MHFLLFVGHRHSIRALAYADITCLVIGAGFDHDVIFQYFDDCYIHFIQLIRYTFGILGQNFYI